MNVLVVEDDANIRETIRLVLESEGYSVLTAVHGEDGLEKLRRMEPPCAMILDIEMPFKDAYQVLAEKNAEPAIASVPVIIASANADAARLPGVCEIVKKPFEIHRLLAAVRKHCPVSGPASS